MAYDRLYYWNKIDFNETRTLLGEIQTNFNMGISINGDKDTCKVVCLSYSIDESIKPYTLVWHENTNTWWIVASDKVERYPNEKGYVYKHIIQLEGAIELLNARDLTDCGFYQNYYTIDQFIKRLFKLSTFEFDDNISIEYNGNIDKDKNVDYIKSFENYTLLSAIREFLDGYNCSAKLLFYTSNGTLNGCEVSIISKTGNADFTPLSMDTNMNDVKGISTMNKNSYGNVVVSNAENVIFTKSKTYPNVGYARLGSTDFYVNPASGDNVLFRLPSKVDSVEWVEIAPTTTMKIGVVISYGSGATSYFTNEFDLSDQLSYENIIYWAQGKLTTKPDNVSQEVWDRLQARLNELYSDSDWESLASDETREVALQNNALRFYDTEKYDPIDNKFISDKPIHIFFSPLNYSHGHEKPIVLGEKKLRNGVQEPESVMYWERGSNAIKGFDFFKWHETAVDNKQVQTQETFGYELMNFDWVNGNYNGIVQVFIAQELNIPYGVLYQKSTMTLSTLNSWLRCKYIPMSNLKIKYDNSIEGKNSKLYNQNGKYTDGVALSKSILSYKNEIESDTITRYAVGYSFSSMPKVGETYIKDEVPYIIGNASYDISPNEDGYFINAEYTLSKKIAVKTMLTNPNTNIRDYGIPQQFNVERKQLYRDFYELSSKLDQNQDQSRYLDLESVVNFTHLPSSIESHTAFIKCQYDHATGGGGKDYDGNIVPPSTEWCYQVDSVVNYLKKAVCEVISLQDNNIIGYDSQNLTCGFDIRRVFEALVIGSFDIDAVNTPIQYTDDNGRVMAFTISMLNNTNLKKVWDTYKTDKEQQYSTTYSGSLYNRCVFIPTELFDMSVSYADYLITDFSYEKDAIEVPIFEYMCQVDDSDDVTIGEDILANNEDDYCYFYEAVFVPKRVVNNNNWRLYLEQSNIQQYQQYITLNDENSTDKKVVQIACSGTSIGLTGYDRSNIDTTTLAISHSGLVNMKSLMSDDTDLMIVRYTVPKNYTLRQGIYVENVKTDLMFILRNPNNFPYVPLLNILGVMVNHYKLR